MNEYKVEAKLSLPVKARDEENAEKKARKYLFSRLERDAANKELSFEEILQAIEVEEEEDGA